jgi:tripartite-type tricarboxylate transporter receptor subunit TctC
MKKCRRLTHGMAGLALLALSTLGIAHAQGYPTRPIKLIVPFSAGGPSDILGRTVAQKLGERLGQPVIVENRVGAGAMLGTTVVAKSPPDGYTLLLGASSALVYGPLINKDPPYDVSKDLTPISLLVHHPTILIVHPSVKANTVGELIALAKANPGTLNYGTQGNGSAPHLMGERFNTMAGVDIVHVAYKGAAPAMTDLVAGRVQMMYESASTALPQIKSGRVRAIAVAGLTRYEAVPELATIAQTLPGYDKSSWNGLLGPAGMPKEIVDRLSAEIVAVFKDPAVRAKMIADGMEPVGSDAPTFAAFMKNELTTWEPVVRRAGLYRSN